MLEKSIKVEIPTPTREQLFNKKREKLFFILSLISLICEVIIVAFYDAIKDSSYLNTKIKPKADKIHQFAKDIQQSINSSIKLNPEWQDHMENYHAVEVYRLLKNMAMKPTDHLKAFNDAFEDQLKQYRENN